MMKTIPTLVTMWAGAPAIALFVGVPAVLGLAPPAAASAGMSSIEHARISPNPSVVNDTKCPDADDDGICDDFCPDFDGDGWCDGDKPDSGTPPDVPEPECIEEPYGCPGQ